VNENSLSQNNEDNDLISELYLDSKIYIKEEMLKYLSEDKKAVGL
jgi:hypothetical protein